MVAVMFRFAGRHGNRCSPATSFSDLQDPLPGCRKEVRHGSACNAHRLGVPWASANFVPCLRACRPPPTRAGTLSEKKRLHGGQKDALPNFAKHRG